jgi:hypothetical protein
MICYDGDADRIYSFTDFEKAVASVEGSVRGYFGEEGPEFDLVCQQVVNKMWELRTAPCIPMRFNTLNVVVYNWELDQANPLHKTLVNCYKDTDDNDLKHQIESLFAIPR